MFHYYKVRKIIETQVKAFPKSLSSLSSHFTDENYTHLIKMVWMLAEQITIRLFPPDGMYILWGWGGGGY